MAQQSHRPHLEDVFGIGSQQTTTTLGDSHFEKFLDHSCEDFLEADAEQLIQQIKVS